MSRFAFSGLSIGQSCLLRLVWDVVDSLLEREEDKIEIISIPTCSKHQIHYRQLGGHKGDAQGDREKQTESRERGYIPGVFTVFSGCFQGAFPYPLCGHPLGPFQDGIPECANSKMGVLCHSARNPLEQIPL